MTIRISNTLTGRKEEFIPLGDPVRMYVCGMTPKYHPHIGHARTYVAADVMRRTLEYRGFRVHHVQNFTDIDDKIIARAELEGVSLADAARRYSESYFAVMDALGVLRAHQYPTVTDSMSEIIGFVDALIQAGYAYVEDADVYFEVARFSGYGKLSGRTEEGGMVGVRKVVQPGKRDPRDFALWKGAKPREPSWPSPWGEGRPGWHIECSAMVRHTLGDQIDIHCGGQDLIFPHHENEIAQSEALTGHHPFARYWPHVALLMTGGEKMAHSLMNFTTVQELLAKYEPAAVRLYLLGTHYRSPMVFSDQSLVEASRSLRTLRAAHGAEEPRLPTDGASSAGASPLERFGQLLDDDFNAPGALGVVFETAHEINRVGTGEEREALRAAFRTMVDVLGIPLQSRQQPDLSGSPAPFIELLVEVRSALREHRQWALADLVRDRLREMGVSIEDTPEGTVWRSD